MANKMDYEDAENEVICDVDTLTDWLSSECIDPEPPVTAIPRPYLDPERIATPQLLAAVIGSPYPGFVFACAKELRERFLQEHMSEIEQRAHEIHEAIRNSAHEKRQDEALAEALGK